MSDSIKLFSEEIILYQPLQDRQILLPDLANCLSVEAFLKMCKLNYVVKNKHNAKYMSPSGELPLMKCNKFFLSGFEAIVKFVERKGVSLTKNLEESQKTEVQAYISFVNMLLANAEQYITWQDKATYEIFTKSSFSSVYQWPLSWIVHRQEKYKAIRKLNAQDWSNKALEEVCYEVNICCQALANRFKGEYFVDRTPTELDAMVFGHTYALLTSPVSQNCFAEIIRSYPEIIIYCEKVLKDYFNK